MKHSNLKTKCSYVVMGLGQFLYGQRIKGILYMGILAIYLIYLFTQGISDMTGLFTLGTIEGDPWLGTKGDDSIIMMLKGILSFMILGAVIVFYLSNIKDIKNIQKLAESGRRAPGFLKSVESFVDKKFYVVALFAPVVGVLIFNVLPIVFMILIAFTNYGGNIVPPKLIDWVGFDNFKQIFAMSGIKETFFRILSWNIVWAVCATVINYFCGLFLALLLNKRCVKGKTFWRAFPIIAYAVPGFITLLGFKFMFSYGGPINYYIKALGGSSIGFLDIDAGNKARLIGLLVNAWISVPTSMLLATGILSNMNNELYEAASLDGAGRWKQFTKLTLPFVVFSTTPTLITGFVGNFNNFGVFYFLRGGLYLDDYFLASDTDLLINWLYNLSIDNNYYGIGAAVSLIIFVITSVISLSTYVNSSAFKKEDTFR
ncbi:MULTISPECIES: carbohydrate ABC transporter permease [Butyrivibrio]|uniref:carbohydrate ABC transporter permease n=1 Tax=Butyrivibrio TaxID=830 RepID=UPI00041FA317|nr:MULTISPECIES: sugar ABC transporter permease [Butyrivibrio]SEQ50148.1 arabinogalactan oligomer / maltooligosaccharide transport system permease protein [Butyrivibrio sp. TB]